MVSRFGDNKLRILMGVFFLGIIIASIYLVFVKIPADQKYCADKGYEYISIDRSWACKDPKTGQLFR